jgi:hypothetical protein
MKIKKIGQHFWNLFFKPIFSKQLAASPIWHNLGNCYPKLMIKVPDWSLWTVLFVYAIKQIFNFWHIIPVLLAQVTCQLHKTFQGLCNTSGKTCGHCPKTFKQHSLLRRSVEWTQQKKMIDRWPLSGFGSLDWLLTSLLSSPNQKIVNPSFISCFHIVTWSYFQSEKKVWVSRSLKSCPHYISSNINLNTLSQ